MLQRITTILISPVNAGHLYVQDPELAITAPAYALAPVGTRQSARTVPTEQLDRPMSTVKSLI